MPGAFSERLAFLLELDPSNAIAGMRRVGTAAERELGKVDNRLQSIGTKMQGVGAGAVAFAGVAARGLYSLAQASEEANRSSLALQNTYSNAPQLAGESAEAVTELAEAIQAKTAADADDIVMGAAVLGQYGAEQDAILQLTPLIVDLARKKGVDMVAANTAIGKAIDGNIGALARMGIQVDEAAFAQDRLTAVTEALRTSVGGFAEAEGATFAGQVERLKNQLGDLAEGVGAGVVDAFSSFTDVTGGVVERLGSMDEGTQRGIGKFAAYATAAAGVVGGLTFLSGTMAKVLDRLAPMTQGVAGTSRSLTTLGKVAAGVTFAATIAGLIEMGNEMNRLQVDVEAFAAVTEGELNNTVTDLLPILEHFGSNAEDIARILVEQNVPAAERFADALERNGQSADGVREIIARKREEDVQATIDQENYTGAVSDAADASGELEGATEAATAATERWNQEIEESIERLEERNEALRELSGQELSMAEAIIQTAEQLASYNEVMSDSESSVLDREQAGIDLLQQFYDEAETARVTAETQATAAGRAETAQREGVEAQIAALTRLAQNLEPGSYLWNQIQGHIANLNSIPRNIETVVGVRINPNYGVGTQPLTSKPGSAFAAGGMVESPVARVNERGVELYTDPTGAEFLLNGQGGNVTPNHRLAPVGAAPAQFIVQGDIADRDTADDLWWKFQRWASGRLTTRDDG